MKKSEWGPRKFTVNNRDGNVFSIVVKGRNRWTLESLWRAGMKGCTPIDNPAPRWSGYVHDLRKLGVQIETITEDHAGPFAGTHARYVLRSLVEPETATGARA